MSNDVVMYNMPGPSDGTAVPWRPVEIWPRPYQPEVIIETVKVTLEDLKPDPVLKSDVLETLAALVDQVADMFKADKIEKDAFLELLEALRLARKQIEKEPE